MIPNPLSNVTGWILVEIHAEISHIVDAESGLSWGLSIVSLTVLARALTLPLVLIANRSTARMGKVAPQLAELRKRYRNDKRLLNEETMKFYKERRVNPLGGCLPILMQIPALSSVYVLLYEASQGYPGHSFSSSEALSLARSRVIGVPLAANLWTPNSDLRALQAVAEVKIIIVCSILLSATLMFLVVRLRHTRVLWQGGAWLMADEKQMRKVSPLQLFMPALVLAEIGLPFALIMYCIAGNLISIIQQQYLRRTS